MSQPFEVVVYPQTEVGEKRMEGQWCLLVDKVEDEL
jgi:hypothetical protein